jgi:hypothetical protein
LKTSPNNLPDGKKYPKNPTIIWDLKGFYTPKVCKESKGQRDKEIMTRLFYKRAVNKTASVEEHAVEVTVT